MIDPEYGRAYARSIPGATFHLIPNAGHMPQIEAPDLNLRAIGEFIDAEAYRGTESSRWRMELEPDPISSDSRLRSCFSCRFTAERRPRRRGSPQDLRAP